MSSKRIVAEQKSGDRFAAVKLHIDRIVRYPFFVYDDQTDHKRRQRNRIWGRTKASVKM